jgi:hypothetical protein
MLLMKTVFLTVIPLVENYELTYTWKKILILVRILHSKTSPHVLNRKLQVLQIVQ